ncbi:Conserved_hypothetical protein [Hexamita inflata]|uniref:Uncharacterized protein n=1 Tax=Hexamita inflata TaxID=28002 RepID=A0AA86TQQ9_9EUKA|nr:Conserved hypothetical protein [Hexamita inflata]
MQALLSHQSNFFQMLAYSQISLKNSRQFFSSQICSNINVGNKLIGYCLKESYLSSRVQSGSVTHSPGNQVHYTLYATKAQDFQMHVTYQMADLPSFALFGLTQSLQLQNSNFSVYVPQQLAQGALVCFQCDVNASTTDFLFSASGQNISGLVMTPFKILVLDNSFAQFRLNGVNVGGVLLNGSGIDLSLVECNISGHITSQNVSGSIAAFVGIITVHASNVKVCANVGRFGQGSVNAVGITDICNLCKDSIYAYGLCVKAFNNSYYNNQQLVCLDSFYFDGEECSCREGQVANGTSCVKILNSVNSLIQNITDLESQMNQMQDIISSLVKQINCTNSGKQYIGDSCVDVSCPILGQKPVNGICQCTNTNAIVQDNICVCPQFSTLIGFVCTGPENSVLINGTFKCVGDLIMQAGVCSCPTAGAAFYNGACTCGVNGQNTSNMCSCPANSVLVSGVCTCNISGQTMKSGACVCTTSGAFVNNGACTCGVNGVNNSNICSCPTNSVLVGNACTCNVISGQTMVSGACACSTFGAFVSGSACTCGVNGLNNSNTCNCPANSALVSGVCTCNVILGQTMKSGVCSCNTTGAFVSNGACTCGVDSLNMSNTCSCPASSSLVGGKCTCSITGQTVQAGACACFTSGAFVSNGACTCGTNSLNTSNVCSCPANSVLFSGVCTCNISGQSMQSGACVCPSGQSLVNGVCSAAVIINGSDSTFQCSQSVYVTTFDIQTATNPLPTPLSFSQYQIFASSSVVTNAFIDISDNVYTTVNPLFQSQTSFTNIKIQIGTQTMTSGSILAPETTATITINQMNILSKAGTTLTLSSWLNILVASSTNTKISTLLVNLNFAMSTGSITLINTASGTMNITGYVILGNYQSSSTVAMISVTVSSGIVNISQVSFKPTVYNVGNSSSYLFGNITSNSFSVSNVAIIIGNSSYQQVLTSVSSTSTNIYQFGGIITNIIGSSKVFISNVISDCYLQISTNYVYQSGFIVGYVQVSSISVSITNLCLQQKITSTTQSFGHLGLIGINLGNSQLQQVLITVSAQGTKFGNFGLIGYNQGNSSLLQIIVTISAQGTNFQYFGLVGYQYENSLYAEVVNARTIIILSNNTGSYVGALFGFQAAINCSIQNASVFNSSIISSSYVGGLIGYYYYYNNNNISIQNSTVSQSNISGSSSAVGGLIGYCYSDYNDRNSNISIQNSTVQQSNISGLNNVGGFIGYQYTYAAPNSSYTTMNTSTLLIQNSNIFQNNISGSQIGGFIGNSTNYKTTITGCKIQQVRITAQNSYVGIVFGYNYGLNTFTFSSSSSIFNYINNVLQQDCATFSNAFTKIGC